MRTNETMDRYDNFMTGMLAGAGLMYLLDPNRGRRRRAMLRDQGVHLANQASEMSATTARDLRNRGIGAMAEARSRLRRDDADEPVVEARVRSQLGRLVSHPGAIGVMVDDGIVTLSGDVLSSEVDDLVDGVGHVRGVRDVREGFTVHQSAEGVPGLQGNSRRPQNRPELLQENWAPSTRLLAGVFGGVLASRGLRMREPVDTVMLVAGIGLLSRAFTNLQIRRLTGVGAGRRAIDVHKIMEVHAPIREVFEFWSDFENLPRFMSHLKDVRNTGGGRSRWTASGPVGLPMTWDAEITAFRQDEVIGWKSIGATPVNNAGIVRFQPIDGSTTRIDVRMSYNPPAGAIGHAVASLFGVDPKRAIDDDLIRFKSLLEEGKTTARGRTVTQEDQRTQLPIEIGSD